MTVFRLSPKSLYSTIIKPPNQPPRLATAQPPSKPPVPAKNGHYLIKAQCTLNRSENGVKVATMIGYDEDYDIILKVNGACEKYRSNIQYCTVPKVEIVRKAETPLGQVSVFWV